MPNELLKTVSVVIPADRKKYLDEAIESVIAQEKVHTEIIVVGVRSGHGIAEVVGRYSQARYLVQKRQGIGDARNTGIRSARGSFLAFLDSDDLWTPDKLTIQTSVLEENPDLDMVFGMIQDFHRSNLNAGPQVETPMKPGVMPGTCVIRKKSFDKVGFFNTQWVFGEFIHWYARACDQNLKSRIVPKVLMKRRIHDTNTGLTQRAHRVDYVRALKAVLDYRRSAGSGRPLNSA